MPATPTARSSWRCRGAVLVVALASLGAGGGEVSSALATSGSDAGAVVAGTEQARAAAGLAGYAVCPDLSAVAGAWAAHMAAQSTLVHNGGLPGEVAHWSLLGENVGEGPDGASVQRAFLASPEHRDNIDSSDFREMGVGVARDSRGTLWVDVVFRQPTAAICSTPAAARPAHRPAQAPPTAPAVQAPHVAAPAAAPAPAVPVPVPPRLPLAAVHGLPPGLALLHEQGHVLTPAAPAPRPLALRLLAVLEEWLDRAAPPPTAAQRSAAAAALHHVA